MIDWVRLAFNTMWIFGASLMLANTSWRSWERQTGLTPTAKEVRNRLVSDVVAILMIGVGLVFVADPWWRKLLWAVVVALLFVQKFLPDNADAESVQSESAGNQAQELSMDEPSNVSREDDVDVSQEE